MKIFFFSFFILLTFAATSQNLIEEETTRYYGTNIATGIKRTIQKDIIRTAPDLDSTNYYALTYQKPGCDSIGLYYRKNKFSTLTFYLRNDPLFFGYLSYCSEHYKRKSDKNAVAKHRFYDKKNHRMIILIRLTPETVTEKRFMIRIIDNKNFGRI